MHPHAITTLYGAGGIGKGFVAAWAYRELIAEGHNPLIIDFEGVRDEWWTRLRWMGYTEPLAYIEASSRLTMSYAANISETVREYGFTHIILDSASTARSRPTDQDSGGSDATIDMFRGMKAWGVPVLLLAHEPKNGEGPIGSIHFQSQSRLLWRASAIPNGTELRMAKANDIAMSDKPLIFQRVPIKDGGIDVQQGGIAAIVEAETAQSAILRVLREKDRMMSGREIQVIINRDGVIASEAVVLATLGKLFKAGLVERPERGRYLIAKNKPNLTGPT